MNNYSVLKETALINFERLLLHWGITYSKITDDEYDFINPLRDDHEFGACRFNIKKGVGADFAGSEFNKRDFERIGNGFTKEDFATLSTNEQTNWGFDVIGLCGKINKCNDYKDSADLLRTTLLNLDTTSPIFRPSIETIAQKTQEKENAKQDRIEYAAKIWDKCKKVKNTLGETYLHTRDIKLNDYFEARFHPRIINKETNSLMPALLFKVSIEPDGELVAIHRIYLSKDGKAKASIAQPKMALGSIKGAGIWCGEIGPKLYIAEGPENALSIAAMGRVPVVSTINASNFPNLTIPKMVKTIVLCPDNDKAGIYYSKKAMKTYRATGRIIKIALPPSGKDFNDLLREGYNG